jgi:porphobilinogen deaminase
MQSVTKYINAKYKMMKARNMFKRIEQIQKSTSIKEELDQIDQIITEINLKAEKKIRKIKDNGCITTIPKLNLKLIQWNRRIRQLPKNKQGQETEIKETIKEKKSAIKQFRQYNQQSYKIRHEEREEK